MFFRDVVGQERVKSCLVNQIDEQRMPHALLLSGKAGVGQLEMALATARYLQCTNRQAGDSCGVCPSCRKHTTMMHPDLHYVFPVHKKDKQLGISDEFVGSFREFVKQNSYFSLQDWIASIAPATAQGLIYTKEGDEIIRKLSLKPYESDFKVMIIWLPEKMHESCANRLLKILEEPYSGTYFILATENADLILGTILSRTQRVEMPNLPHETIIEGLVNGKGISRDTALVAANLCQGSFRQAIALSQENEQQTLYFELFVQMMRLAYARNIRQMKEWSLQVADLGRERQKTFLNYCQTLIRENYIYNLNAPELRYQNNEQTDFSSRFARFVNERNVEDLMFELSTAERDIEQNANAKILFFDLAVKMILLIKR